MLGGDSRFSLCLVAALLALPATSQDRGACTVSCSLIAEVPATCLAGHPIPFEFDFTWSDDRDCRDRYFLVEYGDGFANSADLKSTHIFGAPGTYHWRGTFFGTPDAVCVLEGDILITECRFSAEAKAVQRPGTDPPVVDFSAEVEDEGCACGGHASYLVYDWSFWPDGVHSSEPAPTYTYAGFPPYSWRLWLTKRFADEPDASVAYTSQEGALVTCLKLKDLELCADWMARAQGTNLYTLSGNARLSDLVFLPDFSTFEGDPATGEGILRAPGLTAKTADRTYALYSNPVTEFEVDGTAGTLTPTAPSELFAFSLGGIPLRAGAMATRGAIRLFPNEDKVQVKPGVFLGVPNLFTLALLEATLDFPRDGSLTLRALDYAGGQALLPSIQFAKARYQYFPEQDRLDLTVGWDFPFTEWLEVETTAKFKLGCPWVVDGFDLTVGGGPIGLPLGLPPWGEISHARLSIENLCDPDHFAVFVGGNITLFYIPEEFLLIRNIGGQYRAPKTITLSGGEVNLFGFPVGAAHLTFSGRERHWGALFQGSVNLAGVYEAALNWGISLERNLVTGSAEGSLQIPRFDCAWYNVPCRALRRAILAATELPASISGARAEATFQKAPSGAMEGHLRGVVTLGPLESSWMLERSGGRFFFLVGSNYDDLYALGRGECASANETSQESPVTVPPNTSLALFAAGADAVIPSITLRNPAGQTITPGNAGSFPGVTYLEGDEEKVALFQVLEPTFGTWTLAQEGLPPDQVTMVALAPAPVPRVFFDSVTQQGATVTMAATVSPPLESTRVSFGYARNPEENLTGWVAVDLPATPGRVQATWDTSDAESGSYYLAARVDDGKRPATLTFYPQPVVVDRGLVLPPTGLTGWENGTDATLSWTPSATPSAVQYEVLYTDDLDEPWYRYSSPALRADGASVSGLHPFKDYRFCVVAYDAEGNRSLESEPWFSYFSGNVPGDCDGDGSVSIGEVQKAINMFLGSIPPDCGVDCSWDGAVSIGEVQKVINGFLGVASSCG